MRVATLASRRHWRPAYATLISPVFSQRGVRKWIAKPLVWLASLMGGMFFGKPKDPSDLVVTIEAEDKHDFKDRLAQIKAPTLVAACDQDPFYSQALFRATAEGIPNARLILYKGMGHPAAGKQFSQDVLMFLKEG